MWRVSKNYLRIRRRNQALLSWTDSDGKCLERYSNDHYKHVERHFDILINEAKGHFYVRIIKRS